MRSLIFKALDLGSEYSAQADGEAMEDLTDPWRHPVKVFRCQGAFLCAQDAEAAAMAQLLEWGFTEEAAQRALLAERGTTQQEDLAVSWLLLALQHLGKTGEGITRDHIGQFASEELQSRWEALQAQHGAPEPQADPLKGPETADRLDRLDRLDGDGDGDDIMEETLGNEEVVAEVPAEVPAVSQKETPQRKGAPQLWKVEGTSEELQDSWQRSGQGQKMKKAREALPAFKALCSGARCSLFQWLRLSPARDMRGILLP
eukprot:Skav232412  [mRNA]  locus=scaffold4273:30356:34078:+ [translate_table: standard]